MLTVSNADVGDLTSVENSFARIKSELGEVDALLYNAGSGSSET